MSWQATEYVKSLLECPDGACLSRTQKLLLFVLADYHHPNNGTWPSVLTLAGESMLSRSQVKRHLSYLEVHGIIARKRPSTYGAGHLNAYLFPEIDLTAISPTVDKRVQKDAPFLNPGKKGSERVHFESEKGSERVHQAQHYKEEQETIKQLELKNEEHHSFQREESGLILPSETEKSSHIREATKAWLAAKNELLAELGRDEWLLCVRPALLLNVLSGKYLLIALPPSRQIYQAAQKQKEKFRCAIHGHGFALAGFTIYPDENMRSELARRFPRFLETMLGGTTKKWRSAQKTARM